MNDVYSIFPVKIKSSDNLKYQKHIARLSKHPRFKALVKLLGPLKHTIPIWKSIDDAVLYAVIGQMLSGKASASIIKRLIQKLGSFAEVIKWADKNVRRKGAVAGVSQRKRRALHEWVLYAKNNNIISRKWKALPLSEYSREICGVWGLGIWLADMIAIFRLGRMDVWPETDAGIKKACRMLFKTDKYSNIQKYIKGYESIAAIYLWKMLDNNISYSLTN